MIIINAVKGIKLILGRIGENEARAVRFDISDIQAEFPGASYSVLNMRHSDPDSYPVNGQYVRIDGNSLYWTLQSGDLAEDGLGECEIKATLGNAIVKEVIWTTEVLQALDGNGEPPEPWESWQQQVEDDADRAEAAAEDSEAWAIGERGGEPVEDDDPAYHNNAKYWAEQAEETLAGKADKVSGATNNHFAALDATGNLKDSGHADGDYARKTDTVLTTTLSRGRDATSQVGMGSLAFGDRVKATAPYSRANGSLSEASGMNAAAEGYDAKAAGQNAHAEGFHTRANNKDQHVFGAFNAPDPSTAPAGSQGRFIEIVGNGSSESNRSNARTLDWQGNERLKGDLYVGANADGTGGSKVAKVTDIPEPVDISGKADKVAGAVAGNFAGLDAEGNLTDSGSKASDFLTEHQDISGKADKVTGATNGNLAGLDGSGNLTDSGKKAADFVQVTSFRADAMPMSETDPTTVAQTATELKSAIDQKADLIRDTVSNVPIASVPDATANLPLTALKIAIDPIQAGSGDPSPDNICPITGWTGANVAGTGVNVWDEETQDGYWNSTTGAYIYYAGQLCSKNYISVKPNTTYRNYKEATTNQGELIFFDADKGFISSKFPSAWINKEFTTPDNCYFIQFNLGGSYGTTYNHDISINYPATDTAYHAYTGQTYPISWQTEAGTVYGGWIDPVNGELTVDMASVDLGTLIWAYNSDYSFFVTTVYGKKAGIFNAICSDYPNGGWWSDWANKDNVWCGNAQNNGFVLKDTRYQDAVSFTAAMSGVQLVYELETPVTYQLDPIEVKTLLTAGQMNVWSDTGNVIEMTYPCDTKLYIEKLTKPSEDDMVANNNIASGKFFMVGNMLFLSTQAIAQGANIVPGTNCTAFSLADALNAINQ